MIFDTHIHTRYSVDSDMSLRDAKAIASKRGLGLCVTEHVDYEIDSDKLCVADAEGYFGEYGPFGSDSLLLGLEIGLTVNSRAVSRQTASDPRLDFCIGSVHMSCGHDIYPPSFWRQSIPPEEILGNYLQYTAIVTEKCDFFDSLGHIDYPSRYCPYQEKDIKYKTYKKLYDEIFTALLDRRKVIEINTKRLDDPAAVQNLYEVYEGYYKKGGRYVTLGSDAHHAPTVGWNIDKAFHLAEKIGLIPVHYVKREMRIDA